MLMEGGVARMVHGGACRMRVEAGQYVDGVLMAVVRDGGGRWAVVRVLRKGFKLGSQQGWVAEVQKASISTGVGGLGWGRGASASNYTATGRHWSHFTGWRVLPLVVVSHRIKYRKLRSSDLSGLQDAQGKIWNHESPPLTCVSPQYRTLAPGKDVAILFSSANNPPMSNYNTSIHL